MLTAETRLSFALACRQSHGLYIDTAGEHLKINQIIVKPAEAKSVATVISGAKPHFKESGWHIY